MKRNFRSLIAKACLVLSSAAALHAADIQAAPHAADIQVIASKDVEVTEISAEDLKQIFLETETSLGGAKVKPVLQRGGEAHEAFLKQILGKSGADLDEYYKSLIFSGKGAAPRVLASDAAVVSFVAMSKGAIGYVSAAAIPMGVKKITIK